MSDLPTIVHDYYRQIDGGNLVAALSCFSSDAVYRRPGYAALVGLDSIQDYYENARIIGAGNHHIEAVIAHDDEVAVRGSFDGRSHDGRPLSVRFADFWRFSDQLVVERNTYFDAAAV